MRKQKSVKELFHFGKGYNWLKSPVSFKNIQFYGYCDDSQSWKGMKIKKTVEPVRLETLKIMTLNIWFDKYECVNRWINQFSIFEQYMPDVICLQEVTSGYLKLFSNSKKMKQLYFVSDDPRKPSTLSAGYGACILIRREIFHSITRIGKLKLPSTMGRDLIFCNLLVSKNENENFETTIGSIHLESLGNPQVRRSQLYQISDHLQKTFSDALLMGDFNFDSERNFNKNSQPLENDFFQAKEVCGDWINYVDVWKELKYPEDDLGKTFDTVKNLMIKKLKGRTFDGKKRIERMRYDRIMLKSVNFTPSSIKLIGDKKIEGVQGVVFPSDHFGMFCELRLIK